MLDNGCYQTRGVMKKTRLKQYPSQSPARENKRGKQQTRETLIEAAMQMFARQGYRGVSVRDLAAAAGVTTGSLYSNFSGKREVYIAVLDRITTGIEEIVKELAEDTVEMMKKRGGARMEFEFLSGVIRRLLEEASRHEALLQILLREGLGRDPDFQKDFSKVWERFTDAARRALDTYIRAGFAKPYDTELAARALVPMFIAMCLYDVRTGGRRREEIVSLLAAMLHGGASQWVAWKER